MADARLNTFFRAWNIPFESERTETKISDYIITSCFAQTRKYSLALDNFSLSSLQLVPNKILYPCKCPEVYVRGILSNFDQINVSHRRPCSVWIVNLLTWQNAPEGGYDVKSREMAYNWLMIFIFMRTFSSSVKRDIVTAGIYCCITTDFHYAKRDSRLSACGGVMLQWVGIEKNVNRHFTLNF